MKLFFRFQNINHNFYVFLIKEYEDEIYSQIIGEKIFYCSIDNECKRFYNQNDNYKIELVPELFGSHLEGDIRVMLYALHADRDNRENIVVRAIVVRIVVRAL